MINFWGILTLLTWASTVIIFRMLYVWKADAGLGFAFGMIMIYLIFIRNKVD